MSNPLGRTYLFDYDGMQPSSAPVVPSFEAEPSFIEGEKPLTGLEAVEGATENYYNSFANLQSFSRTARKRYGIDITNPDLSDPLQQYMHKAFLKLHAQTATMGQALQQGKKDREMEMAARMQNPNFVARGEGEGEFGQYQSRGFISTAYEEDKALANAVSSGYYHLDSEKKRDIDKVSNRVQELEEMLDDPNLTEQERSRVEKSINALNAATPKRYIHRDPTPPRGGSGGFTEAREMVDWYSSAKKLDDSALDKFTADPNVSQVRYVWRNGEFQVKVSRKDGQETFISLKDVEGGIRNTQGMFIKTFGQGYRQAQLDPSEFEGINDEDYLQRVDQFNSGKNLVVGLFNNDENTPEAFESALEVADTVTDIMQENNNVYAAVPMGGGKIGSKHYKITGIEAERKGFGLWKNNVYKVSYQVGDRKITKDLKAGESKLFLESLMDNNPDVGVKLFEALNPSTAAPAPAPSNDQSIMYDPNKSYVITRNTENGPESITVSGSNMTIAEFNQMLQEAEVTYADR